MEVPCGQKVAITRWNCKCGTHFNQCVGITWHRRPPSKGPNKGPQQVQAAAPSKAAIGKVGNPIKHLGYLEPHPHSKWEEPPEESDRAQYRIHSAYCLASSGAFGTAFPKLAPISPF